ncbi:MAG: hypothetical protein R3F24_12060 [Gammaproteobacteria bacterium]
MLAGFTFGPVLALVAALVTALVTGLGVPVRAVAQSPTPDQIRQLQNLSPEQKRALAEQYGLLDDLEGDGSKSDRPLDEPAVSRPKDGEASRSGAPFGAGYGGSDTGTNRQLQMYLEPPRIQPKDTVLLDLKRQPPATDPLLAPTPAPGIDVLLERALAANPYRLDKLGQLHIPGVRNPDCTCWPDGKGSHHAAGSGAGVEWSGCRTQIALPEADGC